MVDPKQKGDKNMPELTPEQLEEISEQSKELEVHQKQFQESVMRTLKFDPAILPVEYNI